MLQRLVRSVPRSIHRDARQYSTEKIKQDHAYCVDLVRQRDKEGYLCGLLMPSSTQKAYFALRALNVELANVKNSHVKRSESTIALQLRMQWWREAINQIYNKEEEEQQNKSSSPFWQSPIVRAMDRAEQEFGLTKRFLERLVDAREYDLDVQQYTTMNELHTYAEDSVSSLLYLMLECMGIRDDAADAVAMHAGVGVGLVTALRGTPIRMLSGEVPIPAELLRPEFPYQSLLQLHYTENENNNNKQEAGVQESDVQLFQDAVRHVADTAAEKLAIAQASQGQVPKAGRVCLLPVIPALQYLSRLQQVEYQIFHENLRSDEAHRFKLLLLMGRTWLTGVL